MHSYGISLVILRHSLDIERPTYTNLNRLVSQGVITEDVVQLRGSLLGHLKWLFSSLVEKIYGPGNQYVTAAKMILQNSEAMVSIDMPAGPSEVLAIADKHANPVYIASDLLSQVVELSEPTSPELKERIHCVVHGLLATLSPKMQSKAPPHLLDNPSMGTVNTGTEEDCNDLVENTSLQFHPLISLSRDYLACLLFWCMLLGHYFRGLDYISSRELACLSPMTCTISCKTTLRRSTCKEEHR